jgi:hypothetical protein
MAQIPKNLGSGGFGLYPNSGSKKADPLLEILQGIGADLGTLTPATIVSADASDLGTAITLVNEIKGALNAVSGAGLVTTVET